jgi:hypothetical protein
MKSLTVLALAALCLAQAAPAHAGEAAYTVRPTEMKAKPFMDAATVASLGERSPVEILARQASWSQVRSGSTTGWVKMLNLRLDGAGAAKPAGNGVGALFNLAKTGKSGTVATTGVRGLSEEKLAQASPNAEAVERMSGYAVGKEEARGFAKDGKLAPQQVDHVNTGRGAKS